ncbi:MAG: bifunctional glutamate N-acetyltransferase/amino-acid acetyltransferase ArgJ [Zymomonas mobilis subsp. pomaceae]|uniref:Arginine biosynthesis bifunctional protein ArgJ n=1 Tax=Zymomonas mobilis subsp. pomaceae (strain ATCC 29192 / DSM 22645 / JCM 10191 / CCUG 17912 / NBRC 13757 / NCIMB 11200 / NRRL B-4491 / Barker I) TaxID=579138 RepID=F8EUW0_ZYMMT|nr:bifunctional glutamate N-acetyltransferase/amino-acid acetyltransferase ArgJ [Zymomonas mobilis]AEI37248.1 arginine biosynthesis bifunctional protein ArgJ [Zymomonas mobilis subsp. pomaceae ATCC 29192]MDX5948617.1 bifunctional glutamate N-acetyltransferase/amino-acid acetyltransferase ArgJ [Zymomonas mobilis subsp. pomaceae]GEB88423.1 arginine biosynthesis bifunctional protein ArgJ [Zymomonas mobilis subsp. pomaceae]
MIANISPLAPQHLPELPAIDGITLRAVCAGYKDWQRNDLSFFTFAPGTTVAGLTTKSACPSPEVEWCRAALKKGQARALVVNAGNSNAFTGHRGREAVAAITAHVAEHLNCALHEVFVSSTGVIGVPLPIETACKGLEKAFNAPSVDWEYVANAIMTTDTFPKMSVKEITVQGKTVKVVGIIKGSGMIAPDMATMLGYIFTDAAVSSDLLQTMLNHANKKSFSCITVDSDTSTSDTVLAFATGKAGNVLLRDPKDKDAENLQQAITEVCLDLAQKVVRDGEGASKFISITVTGAVSDESAHIVALSIANSPLVKTAIAGEDANWGRVVMAVGKAGQPAERDLLSIRFGGIEVAAKGMVVPDYDEAPVAAHLKGKEIDVSVDLGLGDGRAQVWTCDLTHGYISINADYRS